MDERAASVTKFEKLFPIQADHFDICKYQTRNEAGYEGVVREMRKLLSEDSWSNILRITGKISHEQSCLVNSAISEELFLEILRAHKQGEFPLGRIELC